MKTFRVTVTDEQFAILVEEYCDWDKGDNPTSAELFECFLPFNITSVEEEDRSEPAEWVDGLIKRKAD